VEGDLILPLNLSLFRRLTQQAAFSLLSASYMAEVNNFQLSDRAIHSVHSVLEIYILHGEQEK
jgi:hypothetical protein